MAIVPAKVKAWICDAIIDGKCASRRTLDDCARFAIGAPTQRPKDSHFPRVRRVVDVLGHRRLPNVVPLDPRICQTAAHLMSQIICYHRSRLHLRPGGRSGAPTIVKNAFWTAVLDVPFDHIFTVPQLTQPLNPPGTGWRAPRCRARTPVRTQPPRSIHLPPPQPRNPSTTAQTHPPEPQPQPQRRPDCTGRSS